MLGTRRLCREEALLCRTARIPGPSVVQPPIELADGLDWDAFWNLALRHEVQPLAWASLRSSPEWLARVPATLAEAAERRYFASAVRNAGRRAELRSVLDVLGSAGIPVIPVKGVVLDEGVYGPDVPRTFDDLDVLVHRSDLSGARAELGQLGYHGRAVPRFEEVDHRFHDVQLFRPTNGTHQCLEVHWDLWPASRFGSIVDDLWRRARPGQVAGTDALLLSDEDTLLHLAIHRTSAALRLRFVCDVAELVRRRGDALDWEAIEHRAAAIEARVALHVMLALARGLLDAPVPDGILRRTQPGRVREAILERTCGTSALFRRVPRDDHRQQPRLAYRLLELDRPVRVARSVLTGVRRKRAKSSYNRRTRTT